MNIGSLSFHSPIALAPMEDVTDKAFREICRELGADIVYTEFTSSEAIIREIPKALRKIAISERERPSAIQIFGGKEDSMEEAARITEQFQPDFIDINCGCWVKNHVARGEGAALLKDLARFEKIVKATIRGTKLPVTVKTRLGWDQDSIVILEVARMLEANGVAALTLHCRTRSQAHDKSKADWEWLRKLKETVSIPIIGNGDVFSPEDAMKMLETGCDGVMVGRAAITKPWIFTQIKHYRATGELLPEPTLSQRINLCLRHLKRTIKYKDERDAIRPFRKYYSGYFKGLSGVGALRKDLMQLITYSSVEERLREFEAQTSLT